VYVPERLDDLKGRKRAPLMQVGDSNVARRLFGGHSEHTVSTNAVLVCLGCVRYRVVLAVKSKGKKIRWADSEFS
jgi:hypothetical protein